MTHEASGVAYTGDITASGWSPVGVKPEYKYAISYDRMHMFNSVSIPFGYRMRKISIHSTAYFVYDGISRPNVWLSVGRIPCSPLKGPENETIFAVLDLADYDDVAHANSAVGVPEKILSRPQSSMLDGQGLIDRNAWGLWERHFPHATDDMEKAIDGWSFGAKWLTEEWVRLRLVLGFDPRRITTHCVEDN